MWVSQLLPIKRQIEPVLVKLLREGVAPFGLCSALSSYMVNSCTMQEEAALACLLLHASSELPPRRQLRFLIFMDRCYCWLLDCPVSTVCRSSGNGSSNSLPPAAMDAPNLKVIKQRLDNHCLEYSENSRPRQGTGLEVSKVLSNSMTLWLFFPVYMWMSSTFLLVIFWSVKVLLIGTQLGLGLVFSYTPFPSFWSFSEIEVIPSYKP